MPRQPKLHSYYAILIVFKIWMLTWTFVLMLNWKVNTSAPSVKWLTLRSCFSPAQFLLLSVATKRYNIEIKKHIYLIPMPYPKLRQWQHTLNWMCSTRGAGLLSQNRHSLQYFPRVQVHLLWMELLWLKIMNYVEKMYKTFVKTWKIGLRLLLCNV